MPDKNPVPEVDVTKEWRAAQGQESGARRLRIFFRCGLSVILMHFSEIYTNLCLFLSH